MATGSFTLPMAALLACGLWLLPDGVGAMEWGGLAATGVVAYVMTEWNNRFSLIRIRSRLMSATYLLLMGACPFLHVWDTAMVPVVCMLLAYGLLFMAYQKPRAEGEVFHAFLFTGIGSFFFPPLLLLAPLHYVAMFVQLRVLGWRTFVAGLFGLVLPYWFYAGWLLWQHELGAFLSRWTGAFDFSPPDYACLTLPQEVSFLFLLFFSLTSLAHFVRTSFNDKIRIRMFFYMMLVQELLLIVSVVLLPQHFDVLFRLLVANSAPLLAHYFALARGRWMNAWFIVSLVLLLLLAAFNNLEALWRPS